MTRYRYDMASLVGDYARSGVGLALTLPPLVLVDALLFVEILLAIAAGLFAFFGLKTGLRQASTIALDDGGLGIEGPIRRQVRWDALDRMKIKYYSTRKRAPGWMTLTVGGNGQHITVDSALDGFADIAEHAANAARDNGVTIDDATRDNLSELGIFPDRGRRDVPAASGNGEMAGNSARNGR